MIHNFCVWHHLHLPQDLGAVLESQKAPGVIRRTGFDISSHSSLNIKTGTVLVMRIIVIHRTAKGLVCRGPEKHWRKLLFVSHSTAAAENRKFLVTSSDALFTGYRLRLICNQWTTLTATLTNDFNVTQFILRRWAVCSEKFETSRFNA